MIYHITTQQQWNQAIANGQYTCDSLAAEGFIHCSQPHQIQGVLQRYYANATDLVLLHIDAHADNYDLRLELAPSINDYFPHIYGMIYPKDVMQVEPIDATNSWRNNLFILNASIQIVPMQVSNIAYPLIDEVIALIATQNMQHVTTAFNTSVQGTLTQITHLIQIINLFLTQHNTATDWICHVQIHASNARHILETDKI
jgi:uncharacterized protein (DUF952 family)/uncharacterized protein YqgV (UPF0045/DUF77 family)